MKYFCFGSFEIACSCSIERWMDKFKIEIRSWTYGGVWTFAWTRPSSSPLVSA